MSAIAHHLVRRGFEATASHYNSVVEDDNKPDFKIGTWSMVLLFATGLLYTAIASAISYTYGDVIGTLTMIETPIATAFKASSAEESTEVDAPLLSEDEKSEKQHLAALESDLYLIKQKPITTKIRTALKHLRTQAGPWSRFRGLHVALIYHGIHGLMLHVFSEFGTPFFLRPVVSILATLVLCRFSMTWTHIVISNPSDKRWFQRMPSRKAAKNIILPTAVLAVAEQAAVYVPGGLLVLVKEGLKSSQKDGITVHANKVALIQLFFIALIAIGTVVLVVIPAEVTLKRVEASMLPEEDEAIVPFDRTFAGKVKPEILGGSGAVSMLDAWKTFDRQARIRLIKLYAKVFLIQVTTAIMFVMITVGELHLILSEDIKKVIREFLHW